MTTRANTSKYLYLLAIFVSSLTASLALTGGNTARAASAGSCADCLVNMAVTGHPENTMCVYNESSGGEYCAGNCGWLESLYACSCQPQGECY